MLVLGKLVNQFNRHFIHYLANLDFNLNLHQFLGLVLILAE